MPKKPIMSPRPRKDVDQNTYAGRFAVRLKMLREKAGWTVEELAEQLGVSDQTVYYWETGRRQPKISDLPKIAQVLGVKRVKDILPTQ